MVGIKKCIYSDNCHRGFGVTSINEMYSISNVCTFVYVCFEWFIIVGCGMVCSVSIWFLVMFVYRFILVGHGFIQSLSRDRGTADQKGDTGFPFLIPIWCQCSTVLSLSHIIKMVGVNFWVMNCHPSRNFLQSLSPVHILFRFAGVTSWTTVPLSSCFRSMPFFITSRCPILVRKRRYVSEPKEEQREFEKRVILMWAMEYEWERIIIIPCPNTNGLQKFHPIQLNCGTWHLI